MGGTQNTLNRNMYSFKCFIKKEENSKLSNLRFYPKKLEKEGQMKPTVSRKKKKKVEFNKSETKKYRKISITKKCFFESSIILIKLLAKLIKRKKEESKRGHDYRLCRHSKDR